MSDEPRYEFKNLNREAIASALQRAEHYRLLNEGREAESICRDVLRLDPENQDALVKLLLSLTDQFKQGQARIEQARRIIPQLRDEYQRWYFTGVIFERWAKAHLRKGVPDAVMNDYLIEALRAFEKAESMRPAGNDDTILRWNSCVRLMRAEEERQHRFQRYGADEGT